MLPCHLSLLGCTKCISNNEIPILILRSNAPLWTLKIKKISKQNKQISKLWQIFACCKIWARNDIRGSPGKKTKLVLQNVYKTSIFGALILFFCHGFHECHFVLNYGKHIEHLSKFRKKIHNIFTLFLIYCSSGCIWA